jgi:hypothetical protein
MPISGCVPCRHFSLLDPDNSTRRRCSNCDQPLRLLEQGEFQALTIRFRSGPAKPPTDSGSGPLR